MMVNSNRIYLSILVLTLVFGCANRGRPSGGDIDVDPPVIIKSIPDNFSTNFKGEEIKIYFDEYIKIKDIQKQLIISPPMDIQPDITPLGAASKYISIRIKDTLEDNTTYAFNFGQSIVDNNEENPYPYYRYVFSTGDTIDSLSVKGTILDAKNREPDTFVSVMLYEVDSTYTDSIIYKEKPKYITNTLDSITVFSIDNIKAGKYRLIALKDENGNFTYQQRTDKIGFHKGFIEVPTDSMYTIKLFKENLDFKAVRPKQLGEQKIAFPFEGDHQGMKIELLGDTPEGFKTRITKDAKTDSLYYWYKPKLELDSTYFKVKNKAYVDTLKHKFRKADKDSLIISPLKSGVLGFNDIFTLEGSVPFSKIDTTKIKLMDKDSTYVPYKVKYDSLSNRYSFPIELKEDQKYAFTMLPGALIDFFEETNDTLNYSFRTKRKSDYGNIRVELRNAKFPLILQLINRNGDVKYEKYTKDYPIVDFNDLDPGEYYLRVIFDTNGNKKYDSGNFLKGIQPERVSYMKDLDPVRANFDFIIPFTLLD